MICFFLLFVALDYSIHIQGFLRSSHLPIFEVVEYYALRFVKHSYVLIPLSLTVSTIKVLRKMNARRELVALQVGGLSLQKILKPFLYVGIFCTLLNGATAEYALPFALKSVSMFQDKYIKRSPISEKQRSSKVFELKDGSKLAFLSFDPKNKTFHDVFWIRSIDDIWRIKRLKQEKGEVPLAFFADHIQRLGTGSLYKTASHNQLELPELILEIYRPKRSKLPIEYFSLSALFKEKTSTLFQEKTRHAALSACISLRIARCFIPLLAIVCIAPFCLAFSRISSSFILYLTGVFGVIAYFAFIQAGSILTENRVCSAFASVYFPLFLGLGLSMFRFVRV